MEILDELACRAHLGRSHFVYLGSRIFLGLSEGLNNVFGGKNFITCAMPVNPILHFDAFSTVQESPQ